MNPRHLVRLNSEQRRAVGHIEGPLLIIAGAGSGKTRVITQRINAMLKAGIKPSSILALTFTNKAAREMASRVATEAGHKVKQLTVSTFHSFGLQILKKHIHHLGWRKNFTIYDSSDQKSLIKESARELSWNLEVLNFNHCAQTFSMIKTGRAEWSDLDKSLEPLYREYQNNRKLYNALDFDDLIQLPTELFKLQPEIMAEYHNRYRYIMVDEFQDTSMQQYGLMKLIADGSRNIAVVGDDDQSIYSWRGANFSNMRNFERDYPELQEIKLEQNYRSTSTILDAANHLIRNNKHRKDKQLWTGSGSGKAIALYQPANETEEAQWISNQIRLLKIQDNIRYHDIAVLIRTNNLSRPIEEEFLARNIPYQLSGGTSFFDRAEVKDVIAYLRCMANPDDDISLLRILNTPRRGIGKRSLEIITERAKGISLYQSLQNLLAETDSPLGSRARADLAEFDELINTFRPRFLTGQKLANTLRELFIEIDYWGYLLNEFQNNDKIATFRWKNVESFTASFERWEEHPDNLKPSIFDYLYRITLNGRESESEEGMLNLMTIHAAKGLEFDIVFIAGVEEHIIPHRRSLEDGGNYEERLEEERRLFYVALTRAKMHLYLTSCQQRRIMRELSDMDISPFIAEIPAELITMKEPESEVSKEDAHNYFQLMHSRFSEDEAGV